MPRTPCLMTLNATHSVVLLHRLSTTIPASYILIALPLAPPHASTHLLSPRTHVLWSNDSVLELWEVHLEIQSELWALDSLDLQTLDLLNAKRMKFSRKFNSPAPSPRAREICRRYKGLWRGLNPLRRVSKGGGRGVWGIARMDNRRKRLFEWQPPDAHSPSQRLLHRL